MAADICCLERSPLIAGRLQALLPDQNWRFSTDELSFLNGILEAPPQLIIIGDNGASSRLSLHFCIKSQKILEGIPVFLLGENEFNSIMPADDFFEATPEGLSELEKSIRSLPAGGGIRKSGATLTQEQIRVSAGGLIREELFLKHLDLSITGMDVADSDFGGFLNSLCSRISDLLYADFVFITAESIDGFCGRLHLRRHPGDEAVSAIRSLALEGAPPEMRPGQDEDFQISFREIKTSAAEEINPELFFSSELPEDAGVRGRIAVGILVGGGGDFVPKIAENTIEAAGRIIAKAVEYHLSTDENRLIYRAFTQFLPGPIINDLLLKESEKALLTGEKRRIAVLFSHVRNFDHIIETNEPDRIVDFLNSHFTNMVRIIQKHGGTIDKFIGDAVFAIFGAPISYIDNSRRAADAAIEMINSYRDISTEGLSLPQGGFTIGIGLNEGEAIIGNIGSSDKFDYTAIGDTINLAARLESLTKHYHQDILISRAVYDRIYREYYCRHIDKAKVKGKNEATEIFSLPVDSSGYTEEWKQVYGRGLRMYELGNWYTASEYLEKCLLLRPGDIVCEILLNRCIEYLENPPENWDGSVALSFK